MVSKKDLKQQAPKQSFLKQPFLKQKGQGLSELVLIGGLVVALGISSLSFMGSTLGNKLTAMWAYFGVGAQQPALAVAVVPALAAATSTANPAAASNTSLTPEQLASNAALNALYAALQSGNANLTEVSGAYGNLANANLALAAQLQALAESTVASNPQQSASLNDLAKQVKILGAWQASTALEAYWWGGGQGDTNGLIRLMSTAMAETNTPIGSFDTATSTWIHGAAGAWEPAKSAEAAQQQAQTIATQWAALQQQGVVTALSAPNQSLVTNAANTVLATSDIYTAQNAQATYNNGQLIQTAGAAP